MKKKRKKKEKNGIREEDPDRVWSLVCSFRSLVCLVCLVLLTEHHCPLSIGKRKQKQKLF